MVTRIALLWMAIASPLTFATSLKFTARCSVESPAVPIILSDDPREFWTCDSNKMLNLTRSISFRIGQALYEASAQVLWSGWASDYRTCPDVLKAGHER